MPNLTKGTIFFYTNKRANELMIAVVVPRFRTPWMFSSSTLSRGVALRLDDPGTSVYTIVILVTYMYYTRHL